jgi:NitT/TauT family transport system ATP-binding protein
VNGGVAVPAPLARAGRWLRWTRQWIILAIAVWLWQLWASGKNSPFFPPPSAILSRMHQQWFSGPAAHLFFTADATGNILPSVARILMGLAISAVIAIPLGLALGRSPVVTGFLDPLLQFARAIPVVVAAPVFIALFQFGTQIEVATIVAGTLWPLLLNTIDGARTVDALHLETATAFRMSSVQRVTKVIIPSALPKIFTGLRLSLSLSLILMVFAELVGSSNGIGYEMNNASNSFDMPGFWATLVLIAILGYLMNAILYGVEKFSLSWHRGAKRLARLQPRYPSRSSVLEIDSVSRTYGASGTAHLAVDGISLRIDDGELVTIVGPSGCGKSTLLRCIAGLMPPTSGQVILNGTPVTRVPDGLAVVFQDYSRSLYPWMRVRENVELPLKNSRRGQGGSGQGGTGRSRAERRDRALAALDSVGLAGAAGKYPWQLSGGMQQRVAIARALACDPVLLLMDEPFGSVDAQTREDLEDLVLRVRAERNITILLVTHDIDESVYTGDRVIVLTPGPGRVRADIAVNLSSPRDQIATKESREFAHLRSEVSRLVRGQAATVSDTVTQGTEVPRETATHDTVS